MIRELQTWEWHRAVVAGIFALIAEVALATSMILDRIAKASTPRLPDVRTASPSNCRRRPSSRDHFAWLRDPSRTNVFIPLLMGAGVLLSGLAWLVERIAGRTAGRVGRSPAGPSPPSRPAGARPARPAGGAARASGARSAAGSEAADMSPAYHRAGVAPQRHVLRWVIIAVLVVVGIAALRQATMNRPDPPRAEEGTTVELDVRTNGSRLSLDAAATGLWAACASVVDRARAGRLQRADRRRLRAAHRAGARAPRRGPPGRLP